MPTEREVVSLESAWQSVILFHAWVDLDHSIHFPYPTHSVYSISHHKHLGLNKTICYIEFVGYNRQNYCRAKISVVRLLCKNILAADVQPKLVVVFWVGLDLDFSASNIRNLLS